MSLVDIDELVLRCRDESARLYIREAVACYRAGAYRACIVSTWNAVAFDFIHKLRELDLSGDKNARQVLSDFESIRSGGESKLKEALEFERNIIHVAFSQFELVTPLEKIDLERLQYDRNRCAHPSMQSDEVPYVPSAELARTHLRTVVEILLEREPVQGKAALERIFGEIKSKYFPTMVKDAVDHFKDGPLGRARETLVRSLLLGLTKSNLCDNLAQDEYFRQLAALGAIVEMYNEIAERVLSTDLPRIAASLSDDNLCHLVVFCHRIPMAWEAMGGSANSRVKRYISTQDASNGWFVRSIYGAIDIQELRQLAISRIKDMTIQQFEMLIKSKPIHAYVVFAIERLSRAASFRGAESIFECLILPLAGVMDASDIDKVFDAIVSNDQNWYAGGIPILVVRLFEQVQHSYAQLKPHWDDFVKRLDAVCPYPDKSGWYAELKARCAQASVQAAGGLS